MPSLCLKCGEENKDEARFCNSCGASLTKGASDVASAEPLSSNIILVKRYRVEERIKSGGMGAVYRAYDLHLNKICAVKELIKLSSSSKGREKDIKRFEREAQILSNLHHKYLPRVIDYFTQDNRYYLIMDFVKGHDLQTILNREGKPYLKEDRVISWMVQVCEVLEYLHSQSPPVIYRDLKPSNIMINSEDGNVRLVDFGIARSIDPEFKTSTKAGTLGYSPAEQYKGKADRRSDIYALGATMHHLLTGKKPVVFDFKPVKELNPAVTDRVNNIIMKSLCMNPEDRFQTIKEVYNALRGQGEVSDAQDLKQLDILITQLTIPNSELKKMAIRSLGEMKSHSALPPLIETFKNNEDRNIRKEALIALGNYDDKNVIKLLCDSFSEEQNSEIKAIILKNLGKFKAKEALDLLMNSLDDTGPDVKYQAIVALGNMREKKALEPLFNILKDGPAEFKKDVINSIEMIDPRFLDSWHKEEKLRENKITEKNTIKVICYLFILLIITLITAKFLSDTLSRSHMEENIRKGKEYIYAKDYKKALELFNDIIKTYPAEAEGYYNLGLLYLCTGEKEKSLEAMEKAVKYDKKNGLYITGLGKVYLETGKISAAIGNLKKAIEANKNICDSYLYLGEAYYKNGNNSEAITNFNYCINNFPETDSAIIANGWIKKLCNTGRNNTAGLPEERYEYVDGTDHNRYASGELSKYLKEKNYDKVIKTGDSMLNKHSDEACAYYYKGIAYFEKGDLPSAIDNLEKSIACNKNTGDAYLVLGKAYYKKGNKDRALANFNYCINNFPGTESAIMANDYISKLKGTKNDTWKLLIEANKYLEAKHYDKAIEIYNNVLSKNPGEMYAYYGKGLAYYGKGNFSSAIDNLKKTEAFNKNIPDLYLYLGQAYYKKGDKHLALENFYYCVKNFPGTKSAATANNCIITLNNTGQANNSAMIGIPSQNNAQPAGTGALLAEAKTYLGNGDYDNAIEIYNKVLINNPGEIEAYYGKGKAYYEKGDYANAEIQFKWVLSINPDECNACNALGFLYLKKRFYTESIAYSTKAITLNRNDYRAYYVRGLAYYALGREKDVLSDFKQVIQISPASQEGINAKKYVTELEKPKPPPGGEPPPGNVPPPGPPPGNVPPPGGGPPP